MKPFEILMIYNAIAFLIITILLVLFKKFIKKDKTRDIVLKIIAISVVVIHYSSLYVDFFKNNGLAYVDKTMLLPIFPCHITMWLLLIVAFIKNKESKTYSLLAEFTCFGGTFCALIGVLFNINFLDNPNILDYHIFKGLISHSVMILGTIYLYLFKYVSLTVPSTMKSIILGEAIFVLCGGLVNLLFKIFEIPSVNAMFMLEIPFKEYPFINFYTVGIFSILFSFITLNIYELIKYPKEQRWIFNIRKKK